MITKDEGDRISGYSVRIRFGYTFFKNVEWGVAIGLNEIGSSKMSCPRLA